MPTDYDEFVLKHYGVKGMRWGKRQNRISRAENRALNREASNKFYTEKLNRVVKEASEKGDNVLVTSRFSNDQYPTIYSGKRFVERLMQGSVVDARMTSVYARKADDSPDQPYILNDEPNALYKKQNFRKE